MVAVIFIINIIFLHIVLNSRYGQFTITKFKTQYMQNSNKNFITVTRINLFINSDAILDRDALWSIQGKKHL